MRLGEVFRFEFAYTLRRPTTWIYAAILFGLAFGIVNANARRVPTNVNAPPSLTVFSMSVAMFGILVTAALFGYGAVRDVETGMDVPREPARAGIDPSHELIATGAATTSSTYGDASGPDCAACRCPRRCRRQGRPA
jgi:hypothetical protein